MYLRRRAESRPKSSPLAWLGALMVLAPGAVAQSDATESFLTEHGMDRYAETYLRSRLDRAAGSERDRLLERLGAYYADRLAQVEDADERARLLDAAREMTESAQADELAGLRLAIAIARYRPAEEIAERHRLLLATDEERDRAIALLEESAVAFSRLGEQLERDVLYLERRQRAESARDPGSALPELGEAIRNRSLAKFYAGWSMIYLASLTDAPPRGALEQFAWVLDTPDETPSLERLPRSLLRYDHVARSAIGVAASLSLSDEHRAAIDWFDAIEPEVATQQPVLAQLISRRIEALARAERWEDLRALARSDMLTRSSGSARARLLAVVALRARAGEAGRGSTRLALEDIAGSALAELVRQGELSHVVDLSARFGKLPLDGRGFTVDFVIGSELFAEARRAHADGNGDTGQPATSVAVRGLYENAAKRLAQAVDSDDADAFPRERARAAFEAAACLYYADQLAAAAAGFVHAETLAVEDDQRERALWMAFVTADLLAARGGIATPDRSTLARRYLTEHPSGPRAATMLLRTLGAELIPEAQAVRILRDVPEGDPISALAKRELARLLYRRVRGVQGIARVETAAEFLDLALGQLRMQNDQPGAPSAESRSHLARQILDVALLLDPPERTIARETLAMLDDAGQDSDSDEITLRRVQLALADGHPSEARAHTRSFKDADSRFAIAAARIVWASSLEEWERNPSAPTARAVIADARPFLETETLDPVSSAAAWLWDRTADEQSRDLAIEIDRRVIGSGLYTESSLIRLARLAESAAYMSVATEAWLSLLSAREDGTPEWFEARYESLRLIAAEDPHRARLIFDQLAAIYPSLGTDPWTTRLRELDRKLPAAHAEGTTP